MTHSPGCLLDDLGVLRIGGADARTFLQGQLSNDIERLAPDALLRAALSTPQGRTLALLGLLASDRDVLALMPRQLIDRISTLLKRYVLRSKVTLMDDSAAFRIVGLRATDVASPGVPSGHLCRYGFQADQRMLSLQHLSAGGDSGRETHYAMTRDTWRALDIAAGLPSISEALSGEFVAQMLNLDCLDAISFNKGCYTGQEVIARAHYRGRVKRRMQRFMTLQSMQGSVTLQPGSSGHLQDGRAFRVIDAVMHPDGRCEFLAVAPLAHNEPHDGTSDASSEGGDAASGSGGSEHTRLAVETLPLPYSVPDQVAPL